MMRVRFVILCTALLALGAAPLSADGAPPSLQAG